MSATLSFFLSILRNIRYLLTNRILRRIERKNNYIEKEIDNDEKLRQISLVREIINTNSNPLTDFDDNIFKAIIDKVIVRTPVSFSFVLINGMEFPIDGRKYNDGRKYKTREF